MKIHSKKYSKDNQQKACPVRGVHQTLMLPHNHYKYVDVWRPRPKLGTAISQRAFNCCRFEWIPRKPDKMLNSCRGEMYSIHSLDVSVPRDAQHFAVYCGKEVLPAPQSLGYVNQDNLWLPEVGDCSTGLTRVTILTNGMTYLAMDVKNRATRLVAVTQCISFYFSLVHYWF